MYQFSKTSLEKLKSVEPKLQELMKLSLATSPIDFSIIEGYRDETRQNQLYQEKKSRAKYPRSMHNKIPARAVDIVPYPKGFHATQEEWGVLIKQIKKIAIANNINVRCGHDWAVFKDSPHIELV